MGSESVKKHALNYMTIVGEGAQLRVGTQNLRGTRLGAGGNEIKVTYTTENYSKISLPKNFIISFCNTKNFKHIFGKQNF